MSGAPGSGKSTTAELLRPSIVGAVVIDHDIIRSTILIEDGISFDQAASIAYRLQWALAEAMVKQELSVIVDSICNYQEILDTGIKLAETYNCDYWYIECRAHVHDMDLLDERLRKRVPLRSQRTGVDQPPLDARGTRHVEDSRATFTKWIEHPCRPDDNRVNVIVVDSAGNSEENRDYILKQIFHG
ncbi:hypothetical protein PT974_04947 [Cladobotryum mycophilum]|uniref:ATP-binding protein n=1 Tax=Cladobotryum mycophilum TaxID=491253 RepID=A0ABR0SRC6_9HYPO